jgi:polysaccharide export outer membrane protein
VLALALLLALCARPLFAQTEVAAATSAPGANVKDSLHALVAGFEPGANEEYTIDDGDEIHLDVSGRAELSTNYTLGPDGRITIPSVGSVLLSGDTREQAATAIEAAMQPFYSNPHVTVGVVHYLSNHILLLGAVQRPGLLTFDQPPTLLEVLSRGGIGAGNAQMNDNGSATTNFATGGATAQSIPDHAYIYRGTQQLAIVDLKQLLSGGAFSDIHLRRNDIVLIPVENQLISVLGAVKNPGVIHFNATSSMQVLLAQAGGLAEQAGSNPLIQVVNPTAGSETEIRFKDLLQTHGTNNISLHPGDVIFVPSSGFAKFAYVVDKLNPITTVIGFGAVAAH